MTAGVTGHQDLGDLDTQEWVAHQIARWVSNQNIKLGCSSLAVGTDQLFADAVLKKGASLEAVIPCKKYEGFSTMPMRSLDLIGSWPRRLRWFGYHIRGPAKKRSGLRVV